MVRTRFVCVIALLLATLVAVWAGPELTSAHAYGVNDGTYYVSPTGSDSNPGTQSQPFQTIDKARQAVRTLIAGGMTHDVVVMLRGGTYYESSTINFDQNDSGNNGYKVVYTNYPGEHPVIVGGTQITGWQHDTGNIYKAYLPDVHSGTWTFNDLYENGVAQTKARYPNTGYLTVQSGVSGNPQGAFVYNGGDLPSWSSITGAQVYIWSGANWFSNTDPITSINTSTRTVTLASNTLQTITAGNRYYIQGVKAALDAPGEWYLDQSSGYIYYWPTTSPIENQTIFAPREQNVFSFKGSSSSTPVQNIELAGLTFVGSEFTDTYNEIDTTWNDPAVANRKGIIYMENASHNTITNCTIVGAGFNGVMLNYFSSYNTITNNDISDFGLFGVMLAGEDAGTISAGAQVYDNNYNNVSDNYIHDGGKNVGNGGGIFIYQSGNNTIENNLIQRMPRYGIGMKGVDYVDMPASYSGVSVTWDNHWSFLTSRNNLIENNDISNVIQDSEDAGFISLYGTGAYNTITNNTLHDVTRSFGTTNGIYLDDGTSFTTVTQNLVYGIHGGTQAAGIYAKGVHDVLEDNTLVGASGIDSIGIRSVEGPDRNDSATYEDNIMYNENEPFQFDNWSNYRMSASDYNDFYTSGTQSIDVAGTSDTVANWQAMSPYQFSTTYGSAAVANVPSSANRSLSLVDTSSTGSNGVSVTVPFSPIAEDLTYQFSLDASQTTGAVFANLVDSGTSNTAISLGMSGNGTLRYWLSGSSYSDIQTYSASTWYVLKVVVHMAAHTYDVYVNGSLAVSGASFMASVSSVDQLQVATGFGTGTYYLDDVSITDNAEPSVMSENFNSYNAGSEPTFDEHSITSDPMFVNAAADNFSLSGSSPMTSLGFVGFNSANAGLTSSFGQPYALAGTSQSDGVHLAWGAVSGASSYTVYRSTTSQSGYTSIGTATGTTYTDSTALFGERYYYTVAATVSSVQGPLSLETGVDTPYVKSLLSDNFDSDTTGSAPTGWTLTTSPNGTITVAAVPSSTEKSMELVDTASSGSGVSAVDSFTAQSEPLNYEVVAQARQVGGGAFFNLTDASGNTAVSVGFSGAGTIRYEIPTGIGYVDIENYNANQWYTFDIAVDPVSQTYNVSINGSLAVTAVPFLTTVTSLSKVAFSTGFSTGTYDVDSVTVAGTYLMNETFDSETTSASPAGWNLTTGTSGSIAVANVPGSGNKSMQLVDTDSSGTGVVSTKSFDDQTGTVSYEVRAEASQTTGGMLLEFWDDTNTPAITVSFSGAGTIRYFTSGGSSYTDVQSYSANTWYTIKVVANVSSQTYSLYINGSLAASSLAFENTVQVIDQFAASTGYSTGTYNVDYVTVDRQ